MSKNYALAILEEKEAELKEQLSEVKAAITKLLPETTVALSVVANTPEVKEPVTKAPAAKKAPHITPIFVQWLDKHPEATLDDFKAVFTSYKESTLKTQLSSYRKLFRK